MAKREREEVSTHDIGKMKEAAVSLEVVKNNQDLISKEDYAELLDDTPSDVRDLLIPKILLMQGLSKLVAAEKAVMGEMRDSIGNTRLGGKEAPLEIIPFHSNKTWIVFEEIGGKLEYKSQVPFNDTNAHWKWDDIEGGVKMRRDQSLNYYCLLPSEIKDGMFMPYVVSFRRTSYQAGKKLETAKTKFKMFGRPISSKTFKLIASKQQNEKGTFYVYDVEVGRDTTSVEINAVSQWMSLVKTPMVKVDDSDLHEDKHDTPNVNTMEY